MITINIPTPRDFLAKMRIKRYKIAEDETKANMKMVFNFCSTILWYIEGERLLPVEDRERLKEKVIREYNKIKLFPVMPHNIKEK